MVGNDLINTIFSIITEQNFKLRCQINNLTIMVHSINFFLLFMYFSALKTNLSFLEEKKTIFLQKEMLKISRFYGLFCIYYLLTTPASFKLNHRTPSLHNLVKLNKQNFSIQKF